MALFKVPITEGIQVVRENSIKTDENGLPLRSQSMPKYIPREPYKASTSATPASTLASSPAPSLASVDLQGSLDTEDLHPTSKKVIRPDSLHDETFFRFEDFQPPSTDSFNSVSNLNGASYPQESLSPKANKPVNVVGPTIALPMPGTSNDEGNSLLLAEMKSLHEEKDKLKESLDQQIKVNGELKKLLVASLGNDLQYRVEKLAQDKAHLMATVGNYSKKITEDYEDFDRISIHADMWRSKYYASKLMVEELSKVKAILSRQQREALSAIEMMMGERKDLHANMIQSFMLLQSVAKQLKLNSSRSCSRRNADHQSVLDLSRSVSAMVSDVSSRFLSTSTLASLPTSITEELTQGEILAHQVLSSSVNQTSDPSPGAGLLSQRRTAPLVLPRDEYIPRYQRLVKYEGLLFTCCSKCSGDIVTL